ncbi:helix-turn-helix domain-containing protein [Melissococcus plutonius]|uniref:HTH cro/C1-type domain-containing protein n=1 Tax=Melissococcus plutonius TaxID=33970 RepID=A0A2Z5Y4W5_9ENTE|nr:Rgg/GadR/MutR family transcriptional regulator [Melissococcus plutonius]MCV2498951.1 helix-turn-helix domain-containing protein [Melissococcus plutonius]MCV2501833.1 helix-turn-helix domain-containing protein [Melissococcus plutonius]MCV2505399.1 helix-turn-helix domain-containing protein [Melissococcus plutonius]MCV2507774.1 helix-turn-helix domain-containing protein [Melissococcus plutonius]MCV2520158.1 helix-turn-helix domain-containing protein [Melissococcus plutonius]
MDIIETLKFFRKNLRLKQSDMITSKTVYNNIENNKTNLTIDNFIKIITKFNITPDEFFAAVGNWNNTKINEIEKHFNKCCNDPSFKIEKDKLIVDFLWLNKKTNKSTAELSAYINIKLYFGSLWEEIPTVNEQDIKTIQQLLLNKTFYSYYDYCLFTNTALLFDNKEQDILLSKMYPIKYPDKRNYKTLHAAYLIFPNLITEKLYEKNYTKAREYINLGKMHALSEQHLFLRLQINYFDILQNYLVKGKKADYSKLLKFIYVIKEIYGKDTAKIYEKELEDLLMKVPLNTKLIQKLEVNLSK